MMDPGRQAQIVGDLASIIEEVQAAYACNEVEAFMLVLEKLGEAVVSIIPSTEVGRAALDDLVARMQIDVTGSLASIDRTFNEIKKGG